MIEVRDATAADAAAIGRLLGELGYPTDAADVRTRLALLQAEPAERVVVGIGVSGVMQGVAAMRWGLMLQQPRPIARITTLVVDPDARRSGIGRRLVLWCVATALAAGCERIELTTGLQRTAAHAFYRSLGFEISSHRMSREVGDE